MTTETDTTAETPPTTDTTESGVANAPPDAEQQESTEQETEKPSTEAAKYRRRLRETETQRDGLAERLTTYQRREAERLAAELLVRADDVWLDGADVASVLDDAGEVDPAKVAEVAKVVLNGRPQLGVGYRPRPKPDSAQGAGGRMHARATWSDVLKPHKR